MLGEPRTHLIWSGKWGAWHRRSGDGQACGYTNDILRAGIFETSKAMEYDDGDDAHANRAVPLAEAKAQLLARTEEARALHEQAIERCREFETLAAANQGDE